MRCHEASEWMSLRLDGLLDAQEKRMLDAHLGTCTSCRAEWERMSVACALFAQPAMVAPPGDMQSRIMTRVSRYNARVRLVRRVLLGFLAVLIGGALMMAPVLETLQHTSHSANWLEGAREAARVMLAAGGTLVQSLLLMVDAAAFAPAWALAGAYALLIGGLAAVWMRLVSRAQRGALGPTTAARQRLTGRS